MFSHRLQSAELIRCNVCTEGVSHCDRNLFNGDTAALYRFWRSKPLGA